MITIIILAMVQALYDFAGWYGIYKEQSGHRFEWIFRVVKELLDFIIIPAIAVIYFDVQLITLVAFFIAKWFHLCDSFYNVYRYLLTNKETSVWGFWRWWTPLGLLRTNFWGLCVLKGFTQYEYDWKLGHWRDMSRMELFIELKDIGFSRGMVTIKETHFQALIGLLLAAIMLFIWA